MVSEWFADKPKVNRVYNSSTRYEANRMIKTRFRIILVLFLCTGLLVFIVIDKSSLLRSPKSLGRLVFTDFAKPSYHYTVDVFDLERGIRSSLKWEAYQDVGSLWVIDGRHFY